MYEPHQKYVLYVSHLSGTTTKVPTRFNFPVPQQCLLNFSPRSLSCPPNPCIFGNLAKMAFQICMGHGGVGGPPKKSAVSGFWPVLRDFPLTSLDLTHFGSYFQVFSPEPLQKFRISANQGKKWIQHPPNRGTPWYEPLAPTFVDPKVP